MFIKQNIIVYITDIIMSWDEALNFSRLSISTCIIINYLRKTFRHLARKLKIWFCYWYQVRLEKISLLIL